jgi:hypothetical protein
MHIIIDTTTVFRDKRLLSPRLRSVALAARKLGGGVWVPNVVLDELKGQVRKEVSAKSADIGLALKSLSVLAPPHLMPIFKEIDVDEVLKNYLTERDQQLEKLAIGTLPYPNLPLQQLVERYYQNLRPYKADGTGFKDHMIWRSFLEFVADRQAASPHMFYLVTDNASDFADNKGGFHDDLLRDAQAFGVDTARIGLERQLHDIIKTIIEPQSEKIKETETRLRSRALEVIAEKGEAIVTDGIRNRTVDIGMPSGISNFGIESFRLDVSDPELTLTHVVDELLVEAILPFECFFNGVAQLSDWEWVEAQLDVRYSDIDEEGHFVAFTAAVDSIATVRFTLDDAYKVTSIEATG